LRASFLPGRGMTVSKALESVVMHQIDLTAGAVLETGCVYLIPLRESLNLPHNILGLANPKSSTGRLDVFTRVICDGGEQFDTIPAGYSGPLYMEVAPRTFPILARPGDRLGQIRFRRGSHQALKTQHVSIDLEGHLKNFIFWPAVRRSLFRSTKRRKWPQSRLKLESFGRIMQGFLTPDLGRSRPEGRAVARS